MIILHVPNLYFSMATTSAYTDLRYLEADTIEAQSEALQVMANNIHYAASILNLQSLRLQQSILRFKKGGMGREAS